MSSGSGQCPTCGATLSPGEQCRERFERCLALDYQYGATYGAVHHLIVLCYMMQHNAYTREAWFEARTILTEALQEGATAAGIREQFSRRYGNSRREWSVTRGAKLTEADGIAWTYTIGDVRLETAEAYCADARRWARSVLADTEAIIQAWGKNS